MCQLTLYSLDKDFDLANEEIKKDLRNFLFVTSVINSQNHPDGHGINFVDGKSGKNIVLKSKRCGVSGEVLLECDKKNYHITSPILFHVRKVSTKYEKAERLAENAHPFEGEEFILAHNGTFTGKHVTAEKDDKIIDSQIFHRELEKNWKEKSQKDDVHKVLQKTVDDFNGKMALIFRQKSTGEVFVIRNGRADLHKTNLLYKGKIVGYAINTERIPIFIINNLAIRFTDFAFELKEQPENIEPLSLFRAGNKDLEKIDDISNYVAPVYDYGRGGAGHGVQRFPKQENLSNTSGVDLKWLINEFIPTTRLSIPEVNLLFTMVGYPLPYTKNRMEFLKGEKKIKKLFNDYYRKNKKEIMDSIYEAGVNLQDFHQLYAFPYFILSAKELMAIKKEVLNG